MKVVIKTSYTQRIETLLSCSDKSKPLDNRQDKHLNFIVNQEMTTFLRK